MWFLWRCRKLDFFVISGTGFVVGFINCWVCHRLGFRNSCWPCGFFPARCCQDMLPEVFVQLVLIVHLPCQPVLRTRTFLVKPVILYCMARDSKIQFIGCFYMECLGAENQAFTIPMCCVNFCSETWRKIFCRNMLLHNLVRCFSFGVLCLNAVNLSCFVFWMG